MSQMTPELSLKYASGVNPKDYILYVEENTPQANQHDEVQDNGSFTNPNSEYTTELDLPQSEQSSFKKKIPLGQINIDADGSVQIKINVNGNEVGTWSIQVEEAQQESRPFDPTDI